MHFELLKFCTKYIQTVKWQDNILYTFKECKYKKYDYDYYSD